MDPKEDSMFGKEVHQTFLFPPFQKLEKYLHELCFWQVFCLEMFLKLLGGATKHWSRSQHVMLGAQII